MFYALRAMYHVFCTRYSVLCSLYSVLRAVYHAVCAAYYLLCAMYCVLCTLVQGRVPLVGHDSERERERDRCERETVTSRERERDTTPMRKIRFFWKMPRTQANGRDLFVYSAYNPRLGRCFWSQFLGLCFCLLVYIRTGVAGPCIFAPNKGPSDCS